MNLSDAIGKTCTVLDAGMQVLVKVFVPFSDGVETLLQTVIIVDNFGNNYYSLNGVFEFGKKIPVKDVH